MPSTYTLNNGIELIGTGEQSGTWGDTTNTNLGLLDTALDGQVSITLASAGNSGSPNTLAITDGAASDGRNRMVTFADGGDLGATAFVQLTPNDSEKIIYVRNNLAGSRSIILFQGTYNASNDYEVPAGTTAVVYFDGAGSGAVAANVFNNAYFDSLRLGGVSVTAIIDDDTMGTATATNIATSESIKAYVDAQVGANNELSEVLANGNTTGGTDIAVSTGDDITFADNSKAIFGADSDLQIYHDSSNSYIKDAGTGNIVIGADAFTYIGNPAGTTTAARFNATGAQVFYHNNDQKLATTSTGIDVTGDVGGDSATISGDLTVDTDTLYVDSTNDRVGVNTSSPYTALDLSHPTINQVAIFRSGDTTATIGFADDTTPLTANLSVVTLGAEGSSMVFNTNSGRSMTIDSSRRVLIGTDTARGDFFNTSATTFLQVEGTTANSAAASIVRNSNDDNGPQLILGKSNGTAVGSDTIVTDDALLGRVSYQGADGSELVEGARIESQVDGTPGANDMPGRLQFYTTADGAASPTERMRITSGGFVGINETDPQALLHATNSSGGAAIIVEAGSGYNARLRILSGNAQSSFLEFGDSDDSDVGEIVYDHSDNQMRFNTAASTQMFINSSGDLNIGQGNSDHDFYSAKLNVSDTSSQVASFTRYASTQNGPSIFLAKSRSATVGTNTIVQSGDDLGFVQFTGADGSAYQPGARIYAEVDGTPGVADMPGRLVFDTTPDGASAGVERMRITNGGRVGINTASESGAPTGWLTIDNDINSADVLTSKASYHIALGVDGGVTDQYIGGIGFGDMVTSTVQAAITAVDAGSSAATSLAFATGNTSAVNEAMRIDSSQRVLIGTTSSIEVEGYYRPKFQVAQAGNTDSAARGILINYGRNNTGGGAAVMYSRHSGTTVGSEGNVLDNYVLGENKYTGWYSDNYYLAANIKVEVDGSPSSADMPGRIVFGTTADGASSPTERMTIKSSGKIGIGITNPTASWSDGTGVQFNPVGEVLANKSDAISLYLNRSSSSGSARHVIGIYENTSPMGYLGMGSGSEFAIVTPSSYISQKVENETSGIQYSSSGTYHFGPWVNKNGSIDLGRSTSGWRDLYLTGGIQFDSRSNKLDDYEEGTWVAAINTEGGTAYTVTTQDSRYTKIGNVCHIECDITFSAEGSGTITLISLPFTPVGNTEIFNGFVSSGTNRTSIQLTHYSGANVLVRRDQGTSAINYWTPKTDWAPTNKFSFTGTYLTN